MLRGALAARAALGSLTMEFAADTAGAAAYGRRVAR